MISLAAILPMPGVAVPSLPAGGDAAGGTSVFAALLGAADAGAVPVAGPPPAVAAVPVPDAAAAAQLPALLAAIMPPGARAGGPATLPPAVWPAVAVPRTADAEPPPGDRASLPHPPAELGSATSERSRDRETPTALVPPSLILVVVMPPALPVQIAVTQPAAVPGGGSALPGGGTALPLLAGIAARSPPVVRPAGSPVPLVPSLAARPLSDSAPIAVAVADTAAASTGASPLPKLVDTGELQRALAPAVSVSATPGSPPTASPGQIGAALPASPPQLALTVAPLMVVPALAQALPPPPPSAQPIPVAIDRQVSRTAPLPLGRTAATDGMTIVATPTPALRSRAARLPSTPAPVPNGVAAAGQAFSTPFVTPPQEGPAPAPPAPVLPASTPPVVHSERLGSVHVAVEQSGDEVRVTLGLAAAAVPLVGAEVPRLVADLAAQGHRLQALEFDGGGSNGAGSGVSYGGSNGGGAARQDQPPPASAPDPAHRDRRAAAAQAAMTSLPATADRYA